MGLTKETLKKLCCSNGWSYGVFWHFDHRNSMLLTGEESYCEEKMAALVNNMKMQVQMLGEGIVGQAALIGKNQWIFSDANNGEWSSMAQNGLEIQCLFSSGLKTVAVIPIDSRGVIQFGSTHKILESSEFVDQTKRLFNENVISFVGHSTSSLNYEDCDLNEWFASFCNDNITPMYSGSCSELTEIAFASDFQQKVESLCPDSTHLDWNTQFHQSGFFVEKLAPEIPCFSTWSNQYSVLTSLELKSKESLKLHDFDTKPIDDSVFEWSEGLGNSVQNSIIDTYMNDSGNGLKGYGNLSLDCSAVTCGVSECVSKLDGNSVNKSKKGLFSELGIEELLNGGTNSSNIANSKRRRLESFSVGSISSSNSINSVPNVLAPKKHEELKNASRKRAKPGESTRPRPKDRQQIQCRIKELKEIIPDGAKCSIDALLDRTIKYMLFLQSLTKYADKVKQVVEPKLIGGANRKLSKTNTSGATWAIEVGDESMVCPIIVEDLNPPGLMLIEMLCEDHGFFLEIVDVIRGFGLNVLKGEMETRQDKIWARFIVEEKTNITRIDVFWSLVQLLQLIDTGNQPMNGWSDPYLNSVKQPPLPGPISVAERFQ